jgi:hypothetical protein
VTSALQSLHAFHGVLVELHPHKWDGDLGRVTHYVPLDTAVAHHKIELLHECFPSQAHHDWWDDETFLALMRLRGVECRQRYAEGFLVAKAVLLPGTA